LYEFNFKNNEWRIIEESLVDPPNAIIGHSCVSFENSLFFFGGRSIPGQHSSDLYEFNFSTMKWIYIQTLNPPTPRKYHNAFVLNHWMFVFGGSNQNDYFDSIYSINLINNHWNPIFSRIEARSYHASCHVQGSKIFISGGENSEKLSLNDLILLEFECQETLFQKKSFENVGFVDCFIFCEKKLKRKLVQVEMSSKKKKLE
jgi:N-acetylneuraminic acid mutarotase